MKFTARRGQSLVELAVTLPVLVSLAVGGLALARVASAQAGLDAATAAAVQVAARQPDPRTAGESGASTFAEVAAGYPLISPAVRIQTGNWERGGPITATAGARLELGVPSAPGLPAILTLRSAAGALVEPYRSRPRPPLPCSGQCLR